MMMYIKMLNTYNRNLLLVMSLRNVRKLYGATALPPPNESSDEEYEPLYAKNSARSAYAGVS